MNCFECKKCDLKFNNGKMEKPTCSGGEYMKVTETSVSPTMKSYAATSRLADCKKFEKK